MRSATAPACSAASAIAATIAGLSSGLPGTGWQETIIRHDDGYAGPVVRVKTCLLLKLPVAMTIPAMDASFVAEQRTEKQARRAWRRIYFTTRSAGTARRRRVVRIVVVIIRLIAIDHRHHRFAFTLRRDVIIVEAADVFVIGRFRFEHRTSAVLTGVDGEYRSQRTDTLRGTRQSAR